MSYVLQLIGCAVETCFVMVVLMCTSDVFSINCLLSYELMAW